MNDTVKIKRPMDCRRREDRGGRVKQDSLGKSVKVRTRAWDSRDDLDGALLEHTVDLEKRPAD